MHHKVDGEFCKVKVALFVQVTAFSMPSYKNNFRNYGFVNNQGNKESFSIIVSTKILPPNAIIMNFATALLGFHRIFFHLTFCVIITFDV